jgi:hypothetical protein
MLGAWAASKWMIPWAHKVGGTNEPDYKAITQGWWALVAVLGSFFLAQIAVWLGRRRAYATISAAATALTILMFLGTAPLQASFLPIVFAQGFVAELFFGWLPLYLPEFPPRPCRGQRHRLECWPVRHRAGCHCRGWVVRPHWVDRIRKSVRPADSFASSASLSSGGNPTPPTTILTHEPIPEGCQLETETPTRRGRPDDLRRFHRR